MSHFSQPLNYKMCVSCQKCWLNICRMKMIIDFGNVAVRVADKLYVGNPTIRKSCHCPFYYVRLDSTFPKSGSMCMCNKPMNGSFGEIIFFLVSTCWPIVDCWQSWKWHIKIIKEQSLLCLCSDLKISPPQAVRLIMSWKGHQDLPLVCG